MPDCPGLSLSSARISLARIHPFPAILAPNDFPLAGPALWLYKSPLFRAIFGAELHLSPLVQSPIAVAPAPFTTVLNKVCLIVLTSVISHFFFGNSRIYAFESSLRLLHRKQAQALVLGGGTSHGRVLLLLVRRKRPRYRWEEKGGQVGRQF